MRGIAVAALCAALAGCATPYGEMGAWGGVTAKRFDETTILVSGRANAFTSQDTMQTYLLRKSAEETVAAGYDLFYIASSQDRTQHGAIALPGQSYSTTTGQAQLVGNQVFGSAQTNTTYMPGQVMQTTLPAGAFVIKLYRGQKPENAPPGLFDAHEVLRYLTPPAK